MGNAQDRGREEKTENMQKGDKKKEKSGVKSDEQKQKIRETKASEDM